MSFRVCIISALIAFAPLANAQQLDFGDEGLPIPPLIEQLAISRRDVELALVEVSQPGDELRRSRLLSDLEALDPVAAAPVILAATVDPSPHVRSAAAGLLARLPGSSQRGEAVMRLLRDTQPTVQCAAARAAAESADPQATEAALSNPDIDVVRAALLGCRRQEDARLIAGVYGSLAPQLRPVAIDVLARCGGGEKIILDALNGSVSEQLAAARAVAALRLTAAADAVERKLSEKSDSLFRRELIRAARAVLPQELAQRHALRALEETDLTVRIAAAECLVAMPTMEALPQLFEQLPQPSEALHDAARRAIVAAGPPAATQAARLLDDPSPARRIDGSWLLGRLRSAESLDRHIALTADPDWQVAAQVADALGRINQPAAGPAIHAMLLRASPLTGQNAPAVQQAILACGRLRYRPALPQITPFLAGSDPGTRPIRAAAAWALGILGDSTDTAACSQLLGLIYDDYEIEQVKFEAIKALGHLKHAPATESLKSWAEGAHIGGSASLRWMSHWAFRQITGQELAYSPPVRPYRPDTLIQDLTGSAASP